MGRRGGDGEDGGRAEGGKLVGAGGGGGRELVVVGLAGLLGRKEEGQLV